MTVMSPFFEKWQIFSDTSTWSLITWDSSFFLSQLFRCGKNSWNLNFIYFYQSCRIHVTFKIKDPNDCKLDLVWNKQSERLTKLAKKSSFFHHNPLCLSIGQLFFLQQNQHLSWSDWKIASPNNIFCSFFMFHFHKSVHLFKLTLKPTKRGI